DCVKDHGLDLNGKILLNIEVRGLRFQQQNVAGLHDRDRTENRFGGVEGRIVAPLRNNARVGTGSDTEVADRVVPGQDFTGHGSPMTGIDRIHARDDGDAGTDEVFVVEGPSLLQVDKTDPAAVNL